MNLGAVGGIDSLPLLEVTRVKRANDNTRRQRHARPLGGERQSIQHILRAQRRLEPWIRTEQLPQGLGCRPLPGNTGNLDRLGLAGFQDGLRQIGATGGLHQEIAAASETEHGDHPACLLDQPIIARIPVVREPGSKYGQVR